MNSEDGKSEQSEGDEFVDELAPGTQLLQGQYTIERFLNAGGFGITYLARNSLDRKVVIKECFPGSFCRRSRYIVQARSRAHQNELQSIVQLFVQEARSLAKLQHPNIVGVHQVFEDNKTAYMALDFVEGEDLLDMIDERSDRLQPDMIKNVLLKVLGAVAFIHGEGMLHRDISPDNILIEQDGNPILIDFGAAREQASKQTRVLSALRVVKDGYSPQEFYITGASQGPHSDLYALGATFYHLLTGEIPPNSQARLSSAASGEDDPYVPLVGRISGFDEAFLASIDKAMAVLPKDRMQSAEAWIAAIEGRKVQEMMAPSEAALAASATLSDYGEPAGSSGSAQKKSGKGGMIAVLMGTAAAAGVAVVVGLPMLQGGDTAEVTASSTTSPATTEPVAAPVDVAQAPSPAPEAPADPKVAEPDTKVAAAPEAPAPDAPAPQPEAAPTVVAEDVGPSQPAAENETDFSGLTATAPAQPDVPETAPTQATERAQIGTGADLPARAEASTPAQGVDPQGIAQLDPQQETPVSPDASRVAQVAPDTGVEPSDASTRATVAQSEQKGAAVPGDVSTPVEGAETQFAAAPTQEDRVPAAGLANQKPGRADEVAKAAAPSDQGQVLSQAQSAAVAEDASEAGAVDSVEASKPPQVASRPVPRPRASWARPSVVDGLEPLDGPQLETILASAQAASAAARLEIPALAPSAVFESNSLDQIPALLDVSGSVPPSVLANPFETAWNVEVPFIPSADQPAVIADVDGFVPPWLGAGGTLRSINGIEIDRIDQIPGILREVMQVTDQRNLPLTFGVKPSGSSDVVEATLFLPVTHELRLLNGTRFETRFADGIWETSVVEVPENSGLDLEVGDVVVAHMATNELINGHDSLAALLQRELDEGNYSVNLAVRRGDAMWISAVEYEPTLSN